MTKTPAGNLEAEAKTHSLLLLGCPNFCSALLSLLLPQRDQFSYRYTFSSVYSLCYLRRRRFVHCEAYGDSVAALSTPRNVGFPRIVSAIPHLFSTQPLITVRTALAALRKRLLPLQHSCAVRVARTTRIPFLSLRSPLTTLRTLYGPHFRSVA